MQLSSETKCFDGWQRRYEHSSESLSCDMQFSVYLPPAAEQGEVPVLYWLSGLTCTDENFSTKAGAQCVASQLGMALVMPDTSPRGEDVPDDPEGGWDFGHGAGFYVNATEAPWSGHYRMFDYISCELPSMIEKTLPLDSSRRCLSGHSMGGHGALMIGLRLPDMYHSVSAFSPIVAPSQVPWGEKAFRHLLGDDRADWAAWDTLELLRSGATVKPMLIDQGTDDPFLEQQLQTHRLESLLEDQNWPMEIRRQQGYDHSYYFIATFIEDHLRFHHRHLQ